MLGICMDDRTEFLKVFFNCFTLVLTVIFLFRKIEFLFHLFLLPNFYCGMFFSFFIRCRFKVS